MSVDEWFLSRSERGNPGTRIDARREPGTAWSTGNAVEPLIHGATYFRVLVSCVERMRRGDLLLFTDWRGDPDEQLDAAGIEVSRLFCDAARRGVVVKGLVWRSHLDRFRFSAKENRHLGEEIEAAGGECLLDMRVRMGGSHHQKFVVLRHPGEAHRDVAFVGGIDLCHSRRDEEQHRGDPQAQPMAAVYGDRPPWHDIQVAIRGPAVADVETVFRERWEDPTPLSRDPIRRLVDVVRRDDSTPGVLPRQEPDPPAAGRCAVQLLRTYPPRKLGYPFAPVGERSVARAYAKVLERARSLVYVEDQYLWSREVAETFGRALRTQPQLRVVAVVPHVPDQDGAFSEPPNLIGRRAALEVLRTAGGDRVRLYGIENGAGTPVYVHAKACIVDDLWATVGSDNFNRRSWTYDSELSAAVFEEPDDDGGTYARSLRLTLAAEHLGRRADDISDLVDAGGFVAAFARAAGALQAWHDGGCRGERPPGQVRPAAAPDLSRLTRAWATPLYRVLYDPDGRPRRARRAGTF